MMRSNFDLVDQNNEARLADALVGQGTNANLHWLEPFQKKDRQKKHFRLLRLFGVDSPLTIIKRL